MSTSVTTCRRVEPDLLASSPRRKPIYSLGWASSEAASANSSADSATPSIPLVRNSPIPRSQVGRFLRVVFVPPRIPKSTNGGAPKDRQMSSPTGTGDGATVPDGGTIVYDPRTNRSERRSGARFQRNCQRPGLRPFDDHADAFGMTNSVSSDSTWVTNISNSATPEPRRRPISRCCTVE